MKNKEIVCVPNKVATNRASLYSIIHQAFTQTQMMKFFAMFLTLFFAFFAFGSDVFSLKVQNGIDPSPIRMPKINMTKSGPYLGIQQGKHMIFELGGERQWKQVKLIKPNTQAASIGGNYNFRYNVIGFDLGYWFKRGRLDFTYGARVVYRSDFENHSFGIAPVVGYKILQFHLQAGYHFLTKPKDQFETNTLFVSLRYVLINNRDVEIKREKKK